MMTELDKVGQHLEAALRSLAAGEQEVLSVHLDQACAILEALVAAPSLITQAPIAEAVAVAESKGKPHSFAAAA
jgi:hypothetical protein